MAKMCGKSGKVMVDGQQMTFESWTMITPTVDENLSSTLMTLKHHLLSGHSGLPHLIVMTRDTFARVCEMERFGVQVSQSDAGAMWGVPFHLSATEMGCQFVAYLEVQGGKRVMVVSDDGTADMVWQGRD